jgi:hypothetical protein
MIKAPRRPTHPWASTIMKVPLRKILTTRTTIMVPLHSFLPILLRELVMIRVPLLATLKVRLKLELNYMGRIQEELELRVRHAEPGPHLR